MAKSAAVDRLTDASRYGGTHKNRFDKDGKGKGKVSGTIILLVLEKFNYVPPCFVVELCSSLFCS